MDEKVLVTGASGYIAMHVINILQSERYHVIATTDTQEKANRISSAFEHYYPYAVLDVVIIKDVTSQTAFGEVFEKHQDIQHVIHTSPAAPVGEERHTVEAEYLIPATEGTKNVLESIRVHGHNVKTVVVTSSFSALMDLDNAADPGCVISEKSWNPITWEEAHNIESKAYAASKKIAEQLVWKFYEDNKDSIKFTLTTVNPPYVFGPHVFEWGLELGAWNTTAKFIDRALNLSPSDQGPFIKPRGICCDVRDAALLHVLPLRNPNLAGHRLFPVNGTGIKQHSYEDGKFNLQRVIDILNATFPELEGKLPAGPQTENQQNLDQLTRYNNDETCRLTEMEFKSFATTLRDATIQIMKVKSRQT
ncbi:LANO_0H03158g1_1 [Lachancea nothofagi CBS 11611]|uniref:LANO_0H03158g1_1 n=1 Tax=Lachancea nothofagi CBS 11611 TaxID=1266666 RepID=A0A1G4KL03_9SACH|nr:LANO_0H03158g1_1 [Lachancea nothofagi CBS 11611]